MNSSENKHTTQDPASTTENLLDQLDSVMYRMGRLMSSRQSEFQKDSGLTAPQFMVLKTLACEGPLRVSDLAALLGVKNPAASMLVQWLESEELIERHHGTDDNRVVLVSLTEKGGERLAHSEGFRRALMRIFTTDLSHDDLEDLVRILGTLADTVARGA